MVLAGDPFFSGGSLWGVANDPSLASLPPEYQSLRFGPSFSCSVEADTGLYVARVGLLEPNATKAGQRVFSVTVNGRSARVDIWKSSGLKVPVESEFLIAVDSAYPSVDFRFIGLTGNAVVSWIDVARASWADL